jgi:HEAT repeat protein
MDDVKRHIATLLSDEDPGLRRRAAEDLDGCEGFAPIAALAAALRDENQGVRDAASRTLSHIGNKNVARAVVEYLADQNITTRNLAAGLLMHLKDASTDALLPYLYDPDHDVRKFAVDILGMNGTNQAVPHLIELLKDPDENVVISAVEALGNIRDEASVPTIAVAFDGQPYVQATAAEALGKIGGTAANDCLRLKFRQSMENPESDPLVRYTIIEALGLIGSKDAYDEIVRFLPTVRGKVRRVLIHALIRIGERCGTAFESGIIAKDDILDALADDDVQIQISAVKGLAAFQDGTATVALLSALSKSETLDTVLLPILEKRTTVMSAIVQCLESRQIHPTKDVIALMGRLLAHIHYPSIPDEYIRDDGRLLQRAIDVIKETWPEATAEIRAAAVDTLFRLDGDQAVEFLDALANEPDPWIRMHVIELLAPLDDVRIPGFIGRFLNDEDEMVRDLAASTLEMRGTSTVPSFEQP